MNGGFTMSKSNLSFNQLVSDIKTKKSSLPYTFVDVDESSDVNVDLTPMNVSLEDLYTGEIKCRLYVLNKMLVGNIHSKSDDGKTTYIHPLKVGKDEDILINPYTLKSCIANTIAQLLRIPLKRINDRRFIFRPNISFRSNKLRTEACVIDSINPDGGITLIGLKQPWIFCYDRQSSLQQGTAKTKDEWLHDIEWLKYATAISESDFGRKKKGQLRDMQSNPVIEFCEYVDGLDGKGTFAKAFSEINKKPDEKPKPPKRHNRFGHGGRTQKKYTIPKSLVEVYDRLISQILVNDHLQDHPLAIKAPQLGGMHELTSKNLKVGDILFTEIDANSQVVTFGRTWYYPWPYTFSISGLKGYKRLADDEFTIDGDLVRIGFLRNLFGYSLEDDDLDLIGKSKDVIRKQFRAKAGKVHFNYATYVSGGSIGDLEVPLAGSPKASSYEFYIRQDSKEHLKTYGDPAFDGEARASLAGRKVYRASIASLKAIGVRKETNVLKSCVHYDEKNAESKYPMFRFTCRFENLTKDELDHFLFALDLYSNEFDETKTVDLYANKLLCHQIGFAKNHGLGAVKILVDQCVRYIYDQGHLKRVVLDVRPSDMVMKKLKDNTDFVQAHKLSDSRFIYPDAPNTKEWHTGIRRCYLDSRR
jgi:CRISPR-associated protein (TIGR03986 family)